MPVTIFQFCTHIGEIFLDLIFPPSADRRIISKLSSADLAVNYTQARISEHIELHSLLNYREPNVRAMIHVMKYEGSFRPVKLLATLLYDAIVHNVLEDAPFESGERFIIIPIPLSRASLRERGFNQCERLVRRVARLDNGIFLTPECKCLKKIHDTGQQSALKRSKRLINLRGCFAVANPDLIAGKTVILVDDVTTTGATFSEAARALIRAGADRVLCFALAH
jgi:competence protein ComFC